VDNYYIFRKTLQITKNPYILQNTTINKNLYFNSTAQICYHYFTYIIHWLENFWERNYRQEYLEIIRDGLVF